MTKRSFSSCSSLSRCRPTSNVSGAPKVPRCWQKRQDLKQHIYQRKRQPEKSNPVPSINISVVAIKSPTGSISAGQPAAQPPCASRSRSCGCRLRCSSSRCSWSRCRSPAGTCPRKIRRRRKRGGRCMNSSRGKQGYTYGLPSDNEIEGSNGGLKSDCTC